MLGRWYLHNLQSLFLHFRLFNSFLTVKIADGRIRTQVRLVSKETTLPTSGELLSLMCILRQMICRY